MSASQVWQLRSPAKVNWTLQIVGRGEDGFHQLHSWFVAVGLYDCLRVEVGADAVGIHARGPQAGGVPTDDSNLVLQAEQLWRQAGGEAPPLAWQLHKEIPAAAGLGGGSGNAAAALCLLQQVASRPPSTELSRLALKLGSDVPFFLQPHAACLLGGRGEQVLARQDPPSSWLVLVNPGWAASTAEVFAAYRPSASAAPPMVTADTRWPLEPGPNHLLAAAMQVVPQLQAFADQLSTFGDFSLSGSGCSFFCPWPSALLAEECAAKLREVWQHVWVVPLLQGPVLAPPQPVEER